MWNIEDLIAVGVWLAKELDCPPNVEVQIVPRNYLKAHNLVAITRPDPAYVNISVPAVPTISDAVEMRLMGKNAVKRGRLSMWYGYSEVFNVILIILDGQ